MRRGPSAARGNTCCCGGWGQAAGGASLQLMRACSCGWAAAGSCCSRSRDSGEKWRNDRTADSSAARPRLAMRGEAPEEEEVEDEGQELRVVKRQHSSSWPLRLVMCTSSGRSPEPHARPESGRESGPQSVGVAAVRRLAAMCWLNRWQNACQLASSSAPSSIIVMVKREKKYKKKKKLRFL